MKSVSATNLTKTYGSDTALNALNFEVREGELFGFIGPDGAGKTSLFRILTSLLLPDSGEAQVLGLDVVTDYRELRRWYGYMPGKFSLYQDLSVEENLHFFADIFGTTVEENYESVKDIYGQIEPFRTRRAADLSGGMKQKLALSCALIHRPHILFLDEPTTGVDAVSRVEFWDMLKKLQAGGLTILVSTPYMEEASRCDRIALLDRGTILETDTPEGVSQRFDQPLYAVKANRQYQLLKALRMYAYTRSVFSFGEFLHYTDTRSDFRPEWLREDLAMLGLDEIEIKPVTPGVEDRLMELMEGN